MTAPGERTDDAVIADVRETLAENRAALAAAQPTKETTP